MHRGLPWLIACAVIALDRVTKIMVQSKIELGSWTEVFPGFGISHVHNRGIAFSFFSGGGFASRFVLHAVIFTAVIVIAWMLIRQQHRGWLIGSAFGLILGGAVGNLIDRILYGWVVDFIHVWIRFGGKNHSWPDFNIADSAITTGACLLIISEFVANRAPKSETVDENAPDSD